VVKQESVLLSSMMLKKYWFEQLALCIVVELVRIKGGNWFLDTYMACVGRMKLYLFASESSSRRTFGVNLRS
jgi:hypothetical protein